MLPATQMKSVVGDVLLTSVVQVVFPGNETIYSYHSDIPDLKVDDFVIVASPRNRSWDETRFFSQELQGYPVVVRVVNIQPTLKDVTKANKWIIQKLDVDAYVRRLALEQQVDILRHRINEEKKKALELAELAKLRDLNPTLGALIDELAALTGQKIEEKPIEVRAHKRSPTKARKVSKATTRRTKKA